MRSMVLVLTLALGTGIAWAEDVATTMSTSPAVATSGVFVNSSIGLNVPLTGADRTARQAEEDAYRRDLYTRSAEECRVLLDSIAKACAITAINVSTQINSNPGQPDYLYVSSNITLQIDLK